MACKKDKYSIAARLFQDENINKHVVNAMYHALEHDRIVVDVLSTGDYQYVKSAATPTSDAALSSAPPNYCAGEQAASQILNRANIWLNITLAKSTKGYTATCAIGDKNYFASACADTPKEAESRAIMASICLYKSKPPKPPKGETT